MTLQMKNRHLALVIYEEREKRNLTQEHLAEIAEVSPRTIQRLESDGTHSKETLMAVAEAFEIDCKELLQLANERAAGDISSAGNQRLKDLEAGKDEIELQKSLLKVENELIEQLSSYWSELVPDFTLNENGRKKLRKLKNEFEINEIMEAMRIAASSYIQFEDHKPTHDSVEIAWNKVGGICRIKRLEKTQPNLSRLYYIRAILKNRLSYLNDGLAIQLMKEAVDRNASIDSLEQLAKQTTSWTAWRTAIENYISEQKALESKENAAN
jgi:transcriptional regulator with XRE-family HTH domain